MRPCNVTRISPDVLAFLRDLCLQVYDITDKQTLQQVQNWVKELQAMVRIVRLFPPGWTAMYQPSQMTLSAQPCSQTVLTLCLCKSLLANSLGRVKIHPASS